MAEARGGSAAGSPAKRRPGVVVTLLALLALALLLALGTWQLQRLQWKEDLLAAIAERMAADPVPLDEIVALHRQGAPIEYRRVTAEGRFLNEREQYFFATHQGRSGYYVYTPLVRADGSFVFVNRGFVDMDHRDPATRSEGLPRETVAVTGLARDRLAEKPSWLVPDNDPARNIFYWKDIEAMAENAAIDRGRLVAFFIDADATPNPGGWPVGGVTIVNLPNNHLQYAVTWYGLALTLAVIFVLRFFRRSDPPEAGPTAPPAP